MKLRKTRIKKEIKANGSIEYIPEYKYWLGWTQFNDWSGCISAFDIWKLWHTQNWIGVGSEFLYTETRAKSMIDFYTKYVNLWNTDEVESMTIKTEYGKYP